MKKVSKQTKLFDSERFNSALALAKEHNSCCINALDILMPLNPDEDTVVALLVKDLFYREILTAKQVEELFGKSVLELINAAIKIEKLSYGENDRTSKLEILRKMFLTMAKDLRVVLMSLVCRLEKLRSARLPDAVLFAKETLDLYVPIADRLGIYSIKTELEDLSFKYTNPVEYKNISEKLKKLKKSCEISIAWIKKSLTDFFANRGIVVDISGRIKGVYSIYKKLKKKGLTSPEDLYDIFAIRIVLPSKRDGSGNHQVDHLYSVLGLVHSEWKPVTRRFKDYIAVPKSNGYKSLHTVVLGLAPKDMDQPVEVQIRDEEMHIDGEFGVAAHWVYKEKGVVALSALKAHADWVKGISDIREGINDLDVFKDKIFVLTPRGEVRDLPVGSTPLDFAYSVHTDIGNRCVMAKVDSRIVPLDYELKNGEVVEIITRSDAMPKLQWLSVVKSSFARNRIKAYFSSLNRDNNIKLGRDILNNNLERIGKPLLDQTYTILKKYLGKNLNLGQRETILEEIGKGGKIAHDVVKKIYPYEETVVHSVIMPAKGSKKPKSGDLAKSVVIEKQVLIGGEAGLPVKLAACCSPKFGDNIIGYVTRGTCVTVHKMGCKMIGALNYDRFVSAHFKSFSDEVPKYLVGIKLVVVPRVGLMNEVTERIARQKVRIKDIQLRELKESGLYEDYFLLEMDDLDKFDVIMDGLENIDGVMKVARAEKA
ncbi:RelA/SpoT family protein [Candidatus Gracilibacteria bacterium]|nr:RelA/SpoT family protein [Candidatus Gracilibacteria bacterium]